MSRRIAPPKFMIFASRIAYLHMVMMLALMGLSILLPPIPGGTIGWIERWFLSHEAYALWCIGSSLLALSLRKRIRLDEGRGVLLFVVCLMPYLTYCFLSLYYALIVQGGLEQIAAIFLVMVGVEKENIDLRGVVPLLAPVLYLGGLISTYVMIAMATGVSAWVEMARLDDD